MARLSSLNAKCVSVFDPDHRQVDKVRAIIGDARFFQTFEELVASKPDAAIVASPPRFHANQSISLLQSGIAVLCEKPMCASVLEARQMVNAAEQNATLLSVGLFRRFFPVSQFLHEIIENRSLGQPLDFFVYEGGTFQWPAQSASFFEKSNSQGGVLADLGVHVLDLLLWWFGDIQKIEYADDAMGGLESNCEIFLKFVSGVQGRVKFSRDLILRNTTYIRFEGGTISFNPGESSKLSLKFNDSKFPLTATTQAKLATPQAVTAPWSFHQSFAAQLHHFIGSVRGLHPPLISGLDGIRSMEIIDYCYKNRRFMSIPWLETEEQVKGALLSGNG